MWAHHTSDSCWLESDKASPSPSSPGWAGTATPTRTSRASASRIPDLPQLLPSGAPPASLCQHCQQHPCASITSPVPALHPWPGSGALRPHGSHAGGLLFDILCEKSLSVGTVHIVNKTARVNTALVSRLFVLELQLSGRSELRGVLVRSSGWSLQDSAKLCVRDGINNVRCAGQKANSGFYISFHGLSPWFFLKRFGVEVESVTVWCESNKCHLLWAVKPTLVLGVRKRGKCSHVICPNLAPDLYSI